MIIAIVTASVLTAMMLVALKASQPKPKRIRVRTRDSYNGRR